MKRNQFIKVILTTIIFLSLSLWVRSRWNVWFGNPPEAVYIPLKEPGRILLTFGDSTALSRNISWQYDSILVPSYVEIKDQNQNKTYMIKAQGEIFESRSGKAAYYVARLRKLTKDTHYSYRVINQDKFSQWYDFYTYNGKSNQDYSFLYVGDVQDSIHGRTNQFLKHAFQDHPESEFLLCGGDLTERPTDAYWEETFRGLDSISTQYPVLNITGNHDYLKYVIRKLERRFSLIFSYFLDSKIEDNHVYTIRYNDAQLFFLDSNREFFYLWTQKDWLEEKLNQSSARWKIVVLHHPIYSMKGENNNLVQRTLFADIIKEAGVDLVLQGHEHAYGRMTNRDKDSIATTPVFTISHCSPKNYYPKNGDAFDKVDLTSKCYQLIRIKTDTLFVSTYDAESRKAIDNLYIVKKGNKVQVIDNSKK